MVTTVEVGLLEEECFGVVKFSALIDENETKDKTKHTCVHLGLF